MFQSVRRRFGHGNDKTLYNRLLSVNIEHYGARFNVQSSSSIYRERMATVWAVDNRWNNANRNRESAIARERKGLISIWTTDDVDIGFPYTFFPREIIKY